MQYGFGMRSFSFASAVVVVVVAACPGRPAGEGEGEGEGESGGEGEGEGEGDVDGPILSEVSCQGGDWVEIKSRASTPQDLAGWFLTDDVGEPNRREALQGLLAPGARVVFDVTTFGIACDESVALLEGDRVQDATTLAVVVEGASWARLPEPIDLGSDFAEAFPTRAQPNQPRVVGAVRLNEIDCRGAERVELKNTGAASVDVGGFVLAIDPSDPAGRFVLPAGSIVAPAAYLVIEERQGVISGFEFSIDCDNGPVLLLDAAGNVVDSTSTPALLPEAFSWGRVDDGVGAFEPTEPTFGASNTRPLELGAGVFDPARRANVVVVVDGADQALLLADPSRAVPCSFAFDADAPVGCTVREIGVDVFSVSFAETARFRGLEELQLDLSGADPSLARAVIGGALFRAFGIPTARVGLAAVDVAGVTRPAALVVEAVEGRALRRVLPSTKHLYESGNGPLDLVADDVLAYDVSVGSDQRDDLSAVVDVLLPLRTAPGFRAGADDVLRVGDTLDFLAVDAWLSNGSGYARARGQHRIHLDGDGQARLFPAGLNGILKDDGDLLPPGSVLVDACLADVEAECRLPLEQRVRAVNDAATDPLLDLAGLIDDVEAALGADADADALAGLRTRLVARSAEVSARLPAAP